MPDDLLPKMKQSDPVEINVFFCCPEAGVRQRDRLTRHDFKPVLINESQLTLIERISTKTNSQSIKHRVFLGISMRDLGPLSGEQIIGVYSHLNVNS